jgi:4-hydroxy-tetrahydrodipicolinate synthase
VKGVFAAAATPMRGDGRMDVGVFERLIDFLIGAGVHGVCLGGATSEYPRTDLADRATAIEAARHRLPEGRALLVGIGAPSIGQVLELGERAFSAAAAAVLLPMPMFFRYAQPDLRAYCVEVSRTLRKPCLLYDLPDFTNPLLPETSIALMRDEEFITGIKDSSGRAENLTGFAGARDDRDWTLLVGHDRLVADGLHAGWDGTVSGVAGFCPELPLAIYDSVAAGDGSRTTELQAFVDELLVQFAALPTPWAVRVGLEVRGFPMGPFPLPLNAERARDVESFRTWVTEWLDRIRAALT